jgi:hypothetical protein
MENIQEVTNEHNEVHIIIAHGNNQFTSMLKSTYETMQAEQSTQPIGGNN